MDEIRLIDANALKKEFDIIASRSATGEWQFIPIKHIKQIIDSAPTVDKGYDLGYADGHGEGYELGKNSRPQSKWIPVSERLPEERQNVLVCVTYKDTTHFTVTCLLNDKQWLLFSDVEVIAWQPLPEPYKRGEENGK